jgi:hypothetical protein
VNNGCDSGGMMWRIFPLLGLLALAACGGDGRNQTAAALPEDGPVSAPAPAYSGRALKGPLQDALIIAEVFENGLWRELDRTHSGHGWFHLQPGVFEGLLRITALPSSQRASAMVCDVPAGCGSHAYAGLVPLSEDFRLTTIVTAEQFFGGNIAVTPLTHLMAEWAQRVPGGLSAQSLELSRQRVAALFALSGDFVNQLPADPSDRIAFAVASEAQRRHGVLAASFAALAAEQSVASALNGISADFVRHAGQLPMAGEFGLRALFSGAQGIAADLFESPALLADWQQRLEQWQALSAANATLQQSWDVARFNELSGGLDQYAAGAALMQIEAALRAQAGQYLWLAQADVPAMMQVAYSAAGHALDAAINGERKLLEANSQCALWRPNRCYTYVVLHQDDQYSAIMRAFPSIMDLLGFLTGGSISPRVEIVGQLHGQQVDINLRVPTPGSQLFSGGLSRLQVDIIAARVANEAAISTLNGTLTLSLPGLDLPEFFTALAPLLTDNADPLQLAGNLLALLGTATELRLGLAAQGTLAPLAEPEAAFRGRLDARTTLGIAALTGLNPGAGLLALQVSEAELETPLGERFYSLPGQPALVFEVGPRLAVELAFGVALNGLPELQVALGGSLDPASGWALSGGADLQWPGYRLPYTLIWSRDGVLLNQAGSSEAGIRLVPVSERGGYLMLGEQIVATMTLDPMATSLAVYFIDGDQQALGLAPLLALLR